MQDEHRLTEIANELVNGDFVLIWLTPDGLPYCPTHLIAMVHYLRDMQPRYIDTHEKLVTLTNILNHRAIDPIRKAMVREAIVQVFGVPGTLAVKFGQETNRMNLELLVFRLGMCVRELQRDTGSS
jgi:hypothetical protein